MNIFSFTKYGAWLISTASGAPALGFTSFMSFSPKSGGRVLSETIEEGQFASYNKTHDAIRADVALGISDVGQDVEITLEALEKLKLGAIKFNIVTPFKEYRNLTLESFSFEHGANSGGRALFVNLQVVEVKEVSAQYSSSAVSEEDAKNQEDASSVNRGRVQATERNKIEELGSPNSNPRNKGG